MPARPFKKGREGFGHTCRRDLGSGQMVSPPREVPGWCRGGRPASLCSIGTSVQYLGQLLAGWPPALAEKRRWERIWGQRNPRALLLWSRREGEETAGWEIFSSGGKAGGYPNIGKAVGRKCQGLGLKSQAPLLGSDLEGDKWCFRGLVGSTSCWRGQAIGIVAWWKGEKSDICC